MAELLAIKDPKPFENIEAISTEYNLIVSETRNEFALMAITAKAVSEIRKLLTDDIVKGFKSLENTKLGFKTDQEHGYPLATIRECLIEAHLMGVKVIGNEFNIIANQMYITKEGFTGKMQRNPRFSKIKLNYGIPRIDQAANRAIVECSATWEFDGNPGNIECEIPVKWNKYSSDDAILGKAERKLRARMWTQATGDILPEGTVEAETAVVEKAKDVTPENQQEETSKSKTESVKNKLWVKVKKERNEK